MEGIVCVSLQAPSAANCCRSLPLSLSFSVALVALFVAAVAAGFAPNEFNVRSVSESQTSYSSIVVILISSCHQAICLRWAAGLDQAGDS